jgi:transcriptional regulator of acetoin/glycerol metabolism
VATLAEIEKDAIRLTLSETGGDRREAARRLGISRSTLYVRIRDLGL